MFLLKDFEDLLLPKNHSGIHRISFSFESYIIGLIQKCLEWSKKSIGGIYVLLILGKF